MSAMAVTSPPFAPTAGSAERQATVDLGLPLSADQRRAIFAAGKAHGLDIDDLRAMTPAGSISLLTRLQASRLIDRLNAGSENAYPKRRSRTPRRPKGIHAFATPSQLNKIKVLRIDLGWTPERLGEWLSKRHHDHGRPMATVGGGAYHLNIDSTADASAVIELLKAVLAKTERARQRRDSRTLDGSAAGGAVEPNQDGLASPLEGGS